MYLSSDVIKKLDAPVLTRADIPYNSCLVFNAGVIKHNGKYVMLFRNDYGDFENKKLEGTNIGVAVSGDGVKWEVSPVPVKSIEGWDIKRIYDPRITEIDGRCYVCFAADTHHGLRGGIGVTEDFSEIEVISLTAPDNRNLVLFPEKIGGNFIRYERPMPVYSRGIDRFDMWLGESPDMIYWGKNRLVLAVEDVSFANNKVGPAASPVKTDKGWLTLFHAVILDKSKGKNGWEDRWQKEYYAGVMLTDLNDPAVIKGMYKEPLIVCDRDYELADGFRKDVIFPCGMILEDSGEVKIYYGASDTVTCLATADVNDLIKLCLDT
ncbi:MAG: glycoside hydrolase family 130 protein [Clostridia bacterium]|nr:glycoside hydrolase family 130 protein [Clostridia bacterium]